MILIIVLWVLLSVVAGYVAEGKGRNGLGVTFLSFLLSPIIGLAVAALMSPNAAQIAKQEIAAGRGKLCPYCAEVIKPDATVCRYCHSDVTPLIVHPPTTDSQEDV